MSWYEPIEDGRQEAYERYYEERGLEPSEEVWEAFVAEAEAAAEDAAMEAAEARAEARAEREDW